MIIDSTFRHWAKTWVEELLVPGKFWDIGTMDSPGCSPIVVAGAGRSLLRRVAWLQSHTTILLANQSNILFLLQNSIFPSFLVISDANAKIQRIVTKARDMGFTGKILSATHCSKFDDGTMWFKNSRMVRENADFLYNTLVDATSPQVTTHILQCGNVVNTSILIINELQVQGRIWDTKIYLTGVDYSIGDSRITHVPQWDFEADCLVEPEPTTEDLISYKGVWTNDLYMAYKHDLEFIMKNGVDHVRLMDSGFLSDIIETEVPREE